MSESKFYLITDAHYYSKKNWVEGEPVNSRERGDQIVIKASPDILDAFVDKIIADDTTDTVLFTGDNVNSGDMTSHYEFRERLEKLANAGKKVYVIEATHDYCSTGDDECFQRGSSRYTETGTEPIPFMRKGELFDFYYDYGAKQAIDVHRESGSYTVKLGEGVRLVMIVDNGNGRSHCGLFEDGVEWLKGQIKQAKEAGDYILLATHHPVISPWEVYRHMVDYEMYGGYRELSELMCSENVRVIFTGHTHVQNIREYKSENGGSFYDVSTISLVNAAGKMRHVTVDSAKGTCTVKSVGIDSAPGIDTGDKSLYEYLYGINFTGLIEKNFPLALTDTEQFIRRSSGALPADKLMGKKGLVKFACRRLAKLKLSFAAKFGKAWKNLTPDEKKYAKNTKLLDAAFIIMRHIFPGDAPFGPDTVEFKALSAAASRLDRLVGRFNISAVKKLIPPGSSLREMAEDFLYNNRTGSDDEIVIDLK